MAAFAYGLIASETKRQYPRRFQNFLDFIYIAGTLDKQVKQFASKAKKSQVGTGQSHVIYSSSLKFLKKFNLNFVFLFMLNFIFQIQNSLI
jgi:hypothetical protein